MVLRPQHISVGGTQGYIPVFTHHLTLIYIAVVRLVLLPVSPRDPHANAALLLYLWASVSCLSRRTFKASIIYTFLTDLNAFQIVFAFSCHHTTFYLPCLPSLFWCFESSSLHSFIDIHFAVSLLDVCPPPFYHLLTVSFLISPSPRTMQNGQMFHG